MSLFNFFLTSTNSFEGKRQTEQVIKIVRKHWITLFWPIFFLVLFTALPFAINYALQRFSWYFSMEQLLWFVATVYYLILWNIFFANIMIYVLNTILLTNERLMENEQKGFFNHVVNEMQLDKVQDISVEMKGVFASLLNYGDMLVQSAGTQNEFHFKTIPNPEGLKKLIMDQRSKYHHPNP